MVGKVDLVVDMRFDGFKQGIGEQMIDAHVHGIAVEGARNTVAGGTKRVVESEIDKAMTDAVTAALRGKKTPEQALKDAAKTSDKALKK